MRLPSSLVVPLLLALALPAPALAKGAQGRVVLEGEEVAVRWSDGDSFKIKSGRYKGKSTRLLQVNTLESYGPVHRWGDWKPAELFEIADGAAAVSASQVWKCHADGKVDGYKRLLVRCPDLARTLAEKGIAMVFEVEGVADPALLAAQKKAQQAKAGIWAKGVPAKIVSSLHSADEGGKETYNRFVDTATGAAKGEPHSNSYETCSEVCAGEGKNMSCLLYVPMENRYRNKPACLRKRGGAKAAGKADAE